MAIESSSSSSSYSLCAPVGGGREISGLKEETSSTTEAVSRMDRVSTRESFPVLDFAFALVFDFDFDFGLGPESSSSS